jgi:hypothetical protein
VLLVIVIVIDVGDLGFEFPKYATEALHEGGLTDALDARDEQTRTIALALLAGAYLKNIGDHSSNGDLHNGRIEQGEIATTRLSCDLPSTQARSSPLHLLLSIPAVGGSLLPTH